MIMTLKELISKTFAMQQIKLIIKFNNGNENEEIFFRGKAIQYFSHVLLGKEVESIEADADELIIKVVYS